VDRDGNQYGTLIAFAPLAGGDDPRRQQ